VTDISGLRTRLGPVEVAPAESRGGRLALSRSYPSPAVDVTYFDFTIPGEREARFEIFDLAGRVVFSIFVAPGSGRLAWDASAAAPGVYLAQLAGERETVSRRLVILR
ncbi:MAG TPA: T9SS type A sorting domain-containing protein, partial [Candidatus Coatesbacteria bacterium]|nr:T9SS type A sorting domain-containing protein [Candidatus Coatesbacteria bacterium]